MPFDPNQPIEPIEAAVFDPSQPIEPIVQTESPPSSLEPTPRDIAEGQEGTFTGTIQQGLRMADQDIDRRSPLDTVLDEENISKEGAPASARLLEGFAFDSKEVKNAVQIGLKRAFGKDVKMRTGPRTGRLEFKNPNTDQWTLVNPPGIDSSDLAALVGEGVVLGPEIVGGVAGSVLSPVAGSAIGVAMGAFAGETSRLRLGQMAGINKDMTDDELILEAAKRAGIAAVAGVAVERILKIGRSLLSGLPTPVGKRAPAIEAGAEEAAEVSKGVEKITGEKLPVTPGQATGDDMILSAEGQLAGKESGQPIRDTIAEQRRVLAKAEEDIQAPFSAPRQDTDIVGRDIQAVARRGPQRGIAVAEAQTQEARQAAENASLIATRGEVDPASASVMARTTMQNGRDAVQEGFSRDYARINIMAEGSNVDLGIFRQIAQKWKRTLDDDILPTLVAEDRALIADAASAKLREETGLQFGARVPGGGQPLEEVTRTVADPASFGSVQRALSILRREIRLAKKGVGGRQEIVALRELHDGLLLARNRALRGKPELGRVIDDVEAKYARARQLVDRSMIGDILKKKEGGGYVLRDDQVIDRILANPSGAKEVARVLDDPQFGAFVEGRAPIRAGILGKYRAEVIDPETGIANPAKHTLFMRKFSGSLRQFFDNSELARMQRPGSAAMMLRGMEKREAGIVKKLNKSFGMRLNNYDSADVVDKVFKPNRIGDIRRTKNITGADSEEWAAFQGTALRKFWGSISSWNPAASAMRVDIKKLSNAIESPEVQKMLSETFDLQFVSDMRVLSSALKLAERRPAVTIGDFVSQTTGSGDVSALHHLMRAYVGILNPRGRMMTAGIRIRGKAAERALIKAFSNVDEMRRLVSMRGATTVSDRAKVILGGMGATILTQPPTSDEIEDFNDLN